MLVPTPSTVSSICRNWARRHCDKHRHVSSTPTTHSWASMALRPSQHRGVIAEGSPLRSTSLHECMFAATGAHIGLLAMRPALVVAERARQRRRRIIVLIIFENWDLLVTIFFFQDCEAWLLIVGLLCDWIKSTYISCVVFWACCEWNFNWTLNW